MGEDMVFGVVMVVLGLFVFMAICSSNSQPTATERSVWATVAEKRVDRGSTLHTDADGVEFPAYYSIYCVTFALSGGRRLEFQVGLEEYKEIRRKSRGTLTYQGSHFLGFRPNWQ